jgi:hypothetical protein
VALLATLGTFWAIRGEHARVIHLTTAVGETVRDWVPPPELEDVARAAIAVTLTHAMVTVDKGSGPLRALLERLGPGESHSSLAGLVTMILAYDPADPASLVPRLALVTDDEGPWTAAILRTQLAQLMTHLGERRPAVEHARAAVPVMQWLGATDDEVQLRSLLVLCAIADGRLADAEAELDRTDAIAGAETVFASTGMRQVGRAELALARGDHAGGLAIYREAEAEMSALRLPGIVATGVEPWAVFSAAAALAAHAHHAAHPR